MSPDARRFELVMVNDSDDSRLFIELSLRVEDGNDVARALYERHHFRSVGRTGGSDTMRLDLDPERA